MEPRGAAAQFQALCEEERHERKWTSVRFQTLGNGLYIDNYVFPTTWSRRNLGQEDYLSILFSNSVAANLPSSLEAKGLAPVINFLSTHTVLSILVFIKFAPRDFNFSLKP